MAESSEPGWRAAAGGGNLDEEEDEEREPLLPRIVWAPPRKSAPGTAVRLVEAAGEEGAASPGEAGDKELLLQPRDAPRSPSRGVGFSRSSPSDPDWNRSLVSGATRLFPSPRGLPRAPVAAATAQPPFTPLSWSPGPLCHTSTCLVGKAVRQASHVEHRPRGQPPAEP